MIKSATHEMSDVAVVSIKYGVDVQVRWSLSANLRTAVAGLHKKFSIVRL